MEPRTKTFFSFSIIIAFCTQRIDIFDKDFWVVSQNYLKRKRDLYKIKQCIYILDNTWRRREDEQREAIYFRGDIPIFNPAGEIINSNYGLNVIEAGHLKSAYVYKTRWNLCRKIAEELEPKIEEYEKEESRYHVMTCMKQALQCLIMAGNSHQ